MIEMNEVSRVEELLATGMFSDKPIRDIDLLSRYFLEKGYTEREELTNLVLSFMESNMDDFLKPKWIDLVESIINRNIKEDRRVNNIDSVCVKKKEIEVIRTLETKEERYLLFTLIVLARLKNLLTKGKSDSWVSSLLSEVFKLANLSCLSKDKQNEVLYKLKTLELISLAKRCDNLSLHIDCLCEDEEEDALTITKLDRLGVAYNNYIKVTEQGYKRCESCGEVVFKPSPKSKKPQLYCKGCAIEINKEQTKERMKKQRKS